MGTNHTSQFFMELQWAAVHECHHLKCADALLKKYGLCASGNSPLWKVDCSFNPCMVVYSYVFVACVCYPLYECVPLYVWLPRCDPSCVDGSICIWLVEKIICRCVEIYSNDSMFLLSFACPSSVLALHGAVFGNHFM